MDVLNNILEDEVPSLKEVMNNPLEALSSTKVPFE